MRTDNGSSKKPFQITFPGVTVVEASAGSGKTYALAKRYVQLITHPHLEEEEDPLKSILAVTFTNKATVEMKTRILEFLRRIALDDFGDDNIKKDILNSLECGSDKAQEKALRGINEILSRYDFFQVRTIDSFINTLLTSSAFRLGLSVGTKVKEDHREYLEYSLDSVIDKIHSDKKVFEMFQRFLRYYLYVENASGWFGKKDILDLIETLFDFSGIYGGTYVSAGKTEKELRQKKKKTKELIKKIYEMAPEKTHKGFLSSIGRFSESPGETFKVEALSNYFTREEFPVNKGGEVSPQIEKMWRELKQELKEIVEDESHAKFTPYIELFDLVMDVFREVSKEDDVIFLSELNTLAGKLLQAGTMDMSELYYRLAVRVKHYLIDEFQDTSRTQWDNLAPMVDEALSSGGSLFYVGDRKQAIFSFRGGEMALFDEVRESFGRFDPVKTVLDVNYRSRKEIVDFNNTIFSDKNLVRFMSEIESTLGKETRLSEKNINTVLDVFALARQKTVTGKQGGYVTVEKISGKKADERNEVIRGRLISRIKTIIKKRPPSDIAVLGRSNSDIKRVTAWLIEEGIAVESDKTLNIREHYLIKELAAFFRFLASPIDSLSFAAFILGDIFTSVSGISVEEVRRFVFTERDEAGKNKKTTALYNKFRRRYPRLWEQYFERFFRSVGFVPLYELAVSVLGKFDVIENFECAHGFFMKFLEVVKSREEEYPDIAGFLDAFERLEDAALYVTPPAREAVTVMTVHKAKGLEFPVVLLPFLAISVKIGTVSGGNKKPYIVKKDDEDSMSLVQLKKDHIQYSERLHNEYIDEYTKTLIGELDTVYVSLTRAEEELHVFVPERAASGKNFAAFLFDEERTEKGKAIASAGRKRLDTKIMRLTPSKHSDWISFLKEETVEAGEVEFRDRILRGNVLHCIMSHVGDLRGQDKTAVLRGAVLNTRMEYPNITEEESKEYTATVETLVNTGALKEFFEITDGIVFTEKEIVDRYGNSKRLDRLIITKNEAVIVDYKSTPDGEEEYLKQIREYMNVVGEIYQKKEIKGYIMYFDTNRIKQVTI